MCRLWELRRRAELSHDRVRKPDEQSRKQAAPDAKTQVTGDDEATRIRDAAATQVSPATTQLLPPSEGPDPAGATEVVKVSTTVAVDARRNPDRRRHRGVEGSR